MLVDHVTPSPGWCEEYPLALGFGQEAFELEKRFI